MGTAVGRPTSDGGLSLDVFLPRLPLRPVERRWDWDRLMRYDTDQLHTASFVHRRLSLYRPPLAGYGGRFPRDTIQSCPRLNCVPVMRRSITQMAQA
jgi:hypothetical protein